MTEEKNEKSFIEKTKAKLKDTTLKTRILAVTILLAIVIIVMSAVVSVAIDPETFTNTEKRNAWLVRTLIMEAIAVFGIIMGEQIGLDLLLQKGKYQVAVQEYQEQRLKVMKRLDCFPDWFIWWKAKELRRKQESFLISEGMVDAKLIMEHIDEIDSEQLVLHPVELRNGTKITKKTERQSQAIKWVQDGNITLETYSPNYYVSRDEYAGEVFTIEKAPKLDRLEKHDIWFSRMYKIVSVIATSTLWSMMTASDFMNIGDVMAWLNLISRLFALFGAFASGWLSANNTKERRVEKINDKTEILMHFEMTLASGQYKPATYEEKARKEMEEYDRQREIDKIGQLDVEHAEGNAEQSDRERMEQ